MTTPDHDPSRVPPDMTEQVMRQLGLAGITPREAKRRRRRRTLLRVALCIVVMGASGLIVVLVSSQPRPSGPTVPSALRHDIEQHGRTFDRTVRSIRGLRQQIPTLTAPSPQPYDGADAEFRDDTAEPSV